MVGFKISFHHVFKVSPRRSISSTSSDRHPTMALSARGIFVFVAGFRFNDVGHKGDKGVLCQWFGNVRVHARGQAAFTDPKTAQEALSGGQEGCLSGSRGFNRKLTTNLLGYHDVLATSDGLILAGFTRIWAWPVQLVRR